MSDLTPRALRTVDASALIGLLAQLEGELMVSEQQSMPGWAKGLATRLSRDGLLATDTDPRQLRQCLNDLNHRVRYALGEYDDPPTPSAVP